MNRQQILFLVKQEYVRSELATIDKIVGIITTGSKVGHPLGGTFTPSADNLHLMPEVEKILDMEGVPFYYDNELHIGYYACTYTALKNYLKLEDF